MGATGSRGRTRHRARIGVVAAVVCLLAASCNFLVRSSTPLGGGAASGASSLASPNHDGRYVVFVSDAPDLVEDDTNGVADVFVRDHETRTTERVSVSGGEGQANGASTAPSISSDGRFVAFASDADDLVAGDTNGVADVFVRDRAAGTTVRASVSDTGAQLPAGGGRVTCRAGASGCTTIASGAAISGDGTKVAFIGQEPGGARSAVVWRDLTADTTTTAAVAPTDEGVPVARFTELAISSDGSTLAVTEERFAPPSAEPTARGLRVLSAETGTTWVSPASDDPVCCHPDLSDDGRFVAFSSQRSHVGEDDPDPDADADVFVFDRSSATYERVSVRTGGEEIDGGGAWPSISGDGALVSWSSADTSLGIPAGPRQTFVRDRIGGRTWVVSRSGSGYANRDSSGRLSGDGSVVAIESAATNLDVAGDTNGATDVFVQAASIPSVTGPATPVEAGAVSTPVVISGSGFRPDTIVESLDPDLRITTVAATSSTRIDLAVTAHPGAVAGPAALRLTNRGAHGTTATVTCNCLTIAVAPAATASGSRPPDVVVVLTDDQRWDTIDELPLLDARDDWARFDRSYVELPLCCPARASYLTGRSSLHTGVDTLRNGHLLDESTTLATMLDGAGYRTALIGKYLNGYAFGRGLYTPPGWDRFLPYWGGGYTDYWLARDDTAEMHGSSAQDYSTDVISAEARSFLRSAAPTEPVLLYVAYNAPHIDATGTTPPAPRHQGECAAEPVTFPPSVGAHDTVSEPAWMAPLTWPDPARSIPGIRAKCAALRSVDEGAASIIDELDRLGRLDNTYVVFTSDNGYSHGEHRLDGKGHLYEESVRVPLMVLGPDVVPGPTPRLTSNVDLAPTIVDWAGVAPPPGFFDGDSYADTLRGAPGPEPSEVLLRGCRTAAGAGDPPCGGHLTGMPNNWGLRTDRYKYIEYPDGDVQLFDLWTDPWELTNLGPDPGSGLLVAQLHARLVQRRGF